MPRRDKEKTKKYSKGYYQNNKEHYKERVKKYQQMNREYIKEYQKKYQQKNRKRIKEQRKKDRYKKRYNLTFEQIDQMLISQNHKCLICGKSLIETKRCIDHDHKTNRIRGLLCYRCNVKLSGVEDTEFLTKAMDYLKRRSV